MAENGNGDPGWNCSDCGELPCVCPNILKDASISLAANLQDCSAVVQIEDNETGNKMAVDMDLVSAAIFAKELHSMLRVLAVMKLAKEN